MSTTNHRISLGTAIDLTRRYRDNRPEHLPICETFESEAILSLLSETGCSYLRIYYGMDENKDVHAILVGADEQNADLLPAAEGETNQEVVEGNEILEDGYRCPRNCPPTSKLNS